MATETVIHTFVLQELRLKDTADADQAARIVAAAPTATGSAVPLLTSIEDERDVAVLRAVHSGETPESDAAQRRNLDGLVAKWHPTQLYIPRISERTTTPPTHYRLAVTESGINNAGTDAITAIRDGTTEATRTQLDLLWVGVPLGTYAGLFVLLGTDGAPDLPTTDPHDWPLPLCRSLGVRIYDSRR